MAGVVAHGTKADGGGLQVWGLHIKTLYPNSDIHKNIHTHMIMDYNSVSRKPHIYVHVNIYIIWRGTKYIVSKYLTPEISVTNDEISGAKKNLAIITCYHLKRIPVTGQSKISSPLLKHKRIQHHIYNNHA